MKRKIEAGIAKAQAAAIAQIIKTGAQTLTLNSARFSGVIILLNPLHQYSNKRSKTMPAPTSV
jgi:hypothetical protein